MLFNENLEEIIFHRHELFDTDELLIISGYVGPSPVSRLEKLPIKSTVIYGMFGSDGISGNLHSALTNLNSQIKHTDIFYSKTPVHSKCYIWRKNNDIVHALVGSANFSSNGVRTPFKEVLAETTFDTFQPLNKYYDAILENSILCSNYIYTEKDKKKAKAIVEVNQTGLCQTLLYDPRTNDIQPVAGLNWGQGDKAHTNPNDAYIPIRTSMIRSNPLMFPPKQEFPIMSEAYRTGHRHNDTIEIIWDDGVTMEGLLEGSQPVDGIKYPKQISTSPNKKDLGEYIRRRIGVPNGAKVTMQDLRKYGRTDITISLLGEGIYYFDFSIKK